eukprot:765895-Hanusia_phi.AAC.1
MCTRSSASHHWTAGHGYSSMILSFMSNKGKAKKKSVTCREGRRDVEIAEGGNRRKMGSRRGRGGRQCGKCREVVGNEDEEEDQGEGSEGTWREEGGREERRRNRAVLKSEEGKRRKREEEGESRNQCSRVLSGQIILQSPGHPKVVRQEELAGAFHLSWR